KRIRGAIQPEIREAERAAAAAEGQALSIGLLEAVCLGTQRRRRGRGGAVPQLLVGAREGRCSGRQGERATARERRGRTQQRLAAGTASRRGLDRGHAGWAGSGAVLSAGDQAE